MKTLEILVLFVLILSVNGVAQVLPPGISTAATYNAAGLGLAGPLGGLEFDAAGTTLYIVTGADLSSGAIYSLPVQRNPVTNRINGFGTPTFVVAAPFADSALQFLPGGVLNWTVWPAHGFGQFIPSTGVVASYSLVGTGAPASTGGFHLVPSWLPNGGDMLISSYCVGGIYKITATVAANGTYAPDANSATLFAALPTGIVGMRHVPSGPDAGSLLVNNFDTGEILKVEVDATTGEARLDTSGNPIVTPFVTGLTWADGIAFDPVSNDFFVTVFDSASTVYHFTGLPTPGPTSAVTTVGAGCVGSNGSEARLGAPLWPFVGNSSFRCDVATAPVFSPAWLLLSSGTAPSPIALSPSCNFYLNFAGYLLFESAGIGPFGPLVTDGSGSGSFPLPLPASPLLRGVRISAQAGILDPGAGVGFAMTNALELLFN